MDQQEPATHTIWHIIIGILMLFGALIEYGFARTISGLTVMGDFITGGTSASAFEISFYDTLALYVGSIVSTIGALMILSTVKRSRYRKQKTLFSLINILTSVALIFTISFTIFLARWHESLPFVTYALTLIYVVSGTLTLVFAVMSLLASRHLDSSQAPSGNHTDATQTYSSAPNLTNSISFYVLHTLLFLQAGALFVLGLIPAPFLLVIGVFLAIPDIIILTKTIPHLKKLSHQRLSIGALLLALFPTICLILSIMINAFFPHALSEKNSVETTPSYIPLFSLFTFVTSLISLHLFSKILKRLPALDNSPINTSSVPRLSPKAKRIIIIVFVTSPVWVGILLGFIKGIIQASSGR